LHVKAREDCGHDADDTFAAFIHARQNIRFVFCSLVGLYTLSFLRLLSTLTVGLTFLPFLRLPFVFEHDAPNQTKEDDVYG
jgi:hypothetical protein